MGGTVFLNGGIQIGQRDQRRLRHQAHGIPVFVGAGVPVRGVGADHPRRSSHD